MAAIDELTPEEYRQRYFDLKARARTRDIAATRQQATGPAEIPAPLIQSQLEIPGGWYTAFRLARGLTLRLVNSEGTPGVSALFWNAADPSERFNAGDTVKVQWSARLGEGRLLLSDMGRVLVSITADSSGAHDAVAGGSSRASDIRKYDMPAPRNTRDNFVLAAAKLGLTARDVPPCVSFFAPVETDQEGRFVWRGERLRAGDYVDLRAEMDLLVALSNCPHPLSPSGTWEPKPVTALVWRSSAPAADDLCRNASEEAVRAFENTEAYLEERMS
jgi:urea carboxylase-associated protein 2